MTEYAKPVEIDGIIPTPASVTGVYMPEFILAGVWIQNESLLKRVMLSYTGEPCRICGKIIEERELNHLIFAGYGKLGRTAHAECWKNPPPEDQWADPIDT